MGASGGPRLRRWYWKAFGQMHGEAVARLRTLLGMRHVIGAVRLARIHYLYAWRLWKYDPRYRSVGTGERELSFVEPMRLWWRGELDGYRWVWTKIKSALTTSHPYRPAESFLASFPASVDLPKSP